MVQDLQELPILQETRLFISTAGSLVIVRLRWMLRMTSRLTWGQRGSALIVYLQLDRILRSIITYHASYWSTVGMIVLHVGAGVCCAESTVKMKWRDLGVDWLGTDRRWTQRDEDRRPIPAPATRSLHIVLIMAATSRSLYYVHNVVMMHWRRDGGLSGVLERRSHAPWNVRRLRERGLAHTS